MIMMGCRRCCFWPAWSWADRPEKLLGLPIRFGWLAFIALGAQWLLVRWPGVVPSLGFGAALLAAHGLLAGCLLLNRRLPGIKLALAGALLNVAVMAANGGLMPITPGAWMRRILIDSTAVVGNGRRIARTCLLAADQMRLGSGPGRQRGD